jgi:hypothetical protein
MWCGDVMITMMCVKFNSLINSLVFFGDEVPFENLNSKLKDILTLKKIKSSSSDER